MRIILLVIVLIFSCEDGNVNFNPYIPNINFDKTINLDLPLYDDVKFSSGSVELSGIGVCGVVIFNFNGDILAWEQCPPNHSVNSSCPKLNISGVQLSCDCTQNLYSLATGQLLNNIDQNNKYPLLDTEQKKSDLHLESIIRN